MDGIYFFGEYERWNLGWSNPNQAGVFIAMFLAWVWGLADFRVVQRKAYCVAWVAFTLILEAGLWFLLSKTYSRGALVAAVLGVFAYAFFSRSRNIRLWAIRLVMVSGIVFATGFFGRVAPDFVAQDGSSINRLTLWKGGVQMVGVSPWQGWGVGRSGEDYMHWFQPFESDADYAGMVNSYLHVAVERGMPVLGGCIAVASWFLILAAGVARRQGKGFSLVASAGASLAVFLVANVFSTLWIFPNLWWLPGIAGMFVLAQVCGRDGWKLGRHALAGAAGVFTLVMLSALLLKLLEPHISNGQQIRLSKGNVVCGTEEGLKKTVLLLPDSSVLGEKWGKEVRKLALHRSDLSVVVPQSDSASFEISSNAGMRVEWIVSFGSRWGEAFVEAERHPAARVILIHPLGKPPDVLQPMGDVLVLIPGLDTTGWGRRWQSSSRMNGWICRQNRGVGQDIRVVWPEVLDGELEKDFGK